MLIHKIIDDYMINGEPNKIEIKLEFAIGWVKRLHIYVNDKEVEVVRKLIRILGNCYLMFFIENEKYYLFLRGEDDILIIDNREFSDHVEKAGRGFLKGKLACILERKKSILISFFNVFVLLGVLYVLNRWFSIGIWLTGIVVAFVIAILKVVIDLYDEFEIYNNAKKIINS